nr:hypothetical protein [Tanacetum cinerariifolium]
MEEVKASMENGVLTVTVPKVEEKKKEFVPKARMQNLLIKKIVRILKVDPSSSNSLDFDLNLSLDPDDYQSYNEYENAFMDMPNPSKNET